MSSQTEALMSFFDLCFVRCPWKRRGSGTGVYPEGHQSHSHLWQNWSRFTQALDFCDIIRKPNAFCADHSGPGAGGTGQEAAVVLQGGAAHLGHVLWELRAQPLLRGGGTTGLTRTPNKGDRGSWNHQPDLGTLSIHSQIPSTMAPLSCQQTKIKTLPPELIMSHGRNISREGNNMACIYLFLSLPKGHFLLAGNSILCVHECAFVTCWRALQDSESKRRTRFILHSVGRLTWGWNRDLFNIAGSKPHVGRQCWQTNSTNFIFVLVHLKIISCRLNIHSQSHKCHIISAKLHHWSVF